MSSIHIVFVGGGTGGHFYPLMSIAEAVSEASNTTRLYYMGPEPYDADALKALNISFVWCPAGKRRKYFSLRNYIDLFKTFFGVIVAFVKLLIIYPDVIMSKGGYTSVPVVIAGWLLNIPIMVHESDALPGSANKLASHFARHVLVSYADTARYFPDTRTTLVGIPIRKELQKPASGRGHELLGTDPSLPLILVLGGSQGAERLNELILDSLDELLKSFNVVHQTGSKHFNVVSASAHELIPDPELIKRYHAVPFLNQNLLNEALHLSTLVISRAGSGTIHEIALHGKPAILIPIPEGISHDQRTNAFTYARTGGAIVIEEANFSDDLLMAEISRIIENSAMYTEMSTAALAFAQGNAGATIAHMALDIGEKHN